MVELIINQNKIELPKDTAIKYTKQISDIFDLANVSCSYTNTFNFEKTPKNTQTMQFLGVNGDSSNIPYIKNEALLKVDGFDLISKGWFNVSGTDDDYQGSIIDGMIDFFKAIENKTIGNDLDLSNFDHEKLLTTVVASFTNEYYQYIIADYGGKVLFEDGINIDYLAPCFSVRKIWELIFSTFGFECDYTYLNYLDGLYITYPKDANENQTNELIATLFRGPYNSQQINSVAGISQPTQYYDWTSVLIDEGTLIDNWKFVISETTSYNFNLTYEMYVIYRKPQRANRITNPSVSILKNGTDIGSFISDYITNVEGVGDEKIINFNLTCNAGDVIEVRIYTPSNLSINNNNYRMYEWRHNAMTFEISKTDLGLTLLQNEFKDFLVKDFIKEIIWRTGLTPISDKENNIVRFIPLDDRVDFDLAQDYSDCYVERKGEIYTNGYAQKNVFKLKNNVDTDLSGDGYLYVPNQNLEDQKTIAQSKIYAPDKKILTEFLGFSTNQYKIWDKEPKDNGEGGLEINYKGLSGRFYFIRKTDLAGSFKIISEKLEDETTVTNIPVGINTNTLFEEAIYNNYTEYQKIFTNFRIHNIDLALNIDRFIGTDLTKPFFFRQENAFYICNKIPFEEGKKSTGEFIKINKL